MTGNPASGPPGLLDIIKISCPVRLDISATSCFARATAWKIEAWEAEIFARFPVEPLTLLEDVATVEDNAALRPAIYVVPFRGDPALFEHDARPSRARSGVMGQQHGPLGRVYHQTLRAELAPATTSGAMAATYRRLIRPAPPRGLQPPSASEDRGFLLFVSARMATVVP